MLERISAIVRARSTYRIGLLQDKAYRVMKREVTAVLAPFSISTTEWALLGLLHDKKIQYPSEAAKELGIEAAFVTVMTRHLKKRGFMQETKDKDDSRRKCISITPAGSSFVDSTETKIRSSLRKLITGVPAGALADYLVVLGKVIENGTAEE